MSPSLSISTRETAGNTHGDHGLREFMLTVDVSA